MGRNKKITALEVLEILSNNQSTKADIANILGVNTATVRNRIKELREDGEVIIHNGEGLILVDKERIETDQELADTMNLWMQKWLLPLFSGFITCARPAQPLLPTLRKSLKESLNSDERKELSRSCLKIKGLLDYIETQEEDLL